MVAFLSVAHATRQQQQMSMDDMMMIFSCEERRKQNQHEEEDEENHQSLVRRACALPRMGTPMVWCMKCVHHANTYVYTVSTGIRRRMWQIILTEKESG